MKGNEFPFKCGRAIVYEDRVVTRIGFPRKRIVEIPWENVLNVRYMNHEYWLETTGNRFLRIGSPRRATRDKFKSLWRERITRQVMKDGFLAGDVKMPNRSDRLMRYFLPAIYLGLILFIFHPWQIPWTHLTPSTILIYLTAITGISSFIGLSVIAFWLHIRTQLYWQGSWRIDRDGFWKLGPVHSAYPVGIEPGDGVTASEIRYGGRKLPAQLFRGGEMFTDLLAIHMKHHGAEFKRRLLWPAMVRTLIIPLVIISWWAARLWTVFPIEGQELKVTFIAGISGFLFMIVIGIFIWRSENREFSEMLERLEPLRRRLGWY